jgi:hypothetical protein
MNGAGRHDHLSREALVKLPERRISPCAIRFFPQRKKAVLF